MKRKVVVAGIGMAVTVGAVIWFRPMDKKLGEVQDLARETASETVSEVVDVKAGFSIFTNGTFRVFTQAMYHNLSPEVFISADNPNMVRVKKSGVTWEDFFDTMPFKLSFDCLTTGTKETFCTNEKGRLKFYLNGDENLQALNREIKNGDKLLVSYGSENESQIQNQYWRVPDVLGVVEPVSEFRMRITKKRFGTYITPQNSPVSPERFSGYHTGVDVEYDDVAGDVPVFAVADGKIVNSEYVSGYGGVVIVRHIIKERTWFGLYGHLQSESMVGVGKPVKRGEQIGKLGKDKSGETDGERKHLHFSLGKTEKLSGYVSSQTELNEWMDPLLLY